MENPVQDTIAGTPTGDITPQLRGETMAFAVQTGLMNMAANLYEPYIGYRFQRYHADHDPKHLEHAGSYGQNLLGEIIGDVTGAAALIGAEALFSQQLHSTTRFCRGLIDPVYDRVARVALVQDCGNPEYEERVERWKAHQERTLIRSAIVDGAGIAGNIAAQKYLIGNPSPMKVIFQGKLLSAAASFVLGLGVRFAMPQYTRSAEKWLGAQFAPMLETVEMPDSQVAVNHAQEQHTLQPDAPRH